MANEYNVLQQNEKNLLYLDQSWNVVRKSISKQSNHSVSLPDTVRGNTTQITKFLDVILKTYRQKLYEPLAKVTEALK